MVQSYQINLDDKIKRLILLWKKSYFDKKLKDCKMRYTNNGVNKKLKNCVIKLYCNIVIAGFRLYAKPRFLAKVTYIM